MTDDEAVYDDFYDDDFCLTNGLVGEALAIPSASPKNFFQAISDTDAMPRQNLWGKLFLPDGAGRSGGAGGAGQPGQPGGAGQPGRSGGAGQSGRSGQPSRLDEPGPYPVVIIAPGSLGLQKHHISYAAELTDAGIAACAIDPFGNRGVISTVENQAQYSFAASAWDVLATAELLAARPEIDATRIGAQGHSRGGSAVLNAASVHLAAASGAPKLVGVYAAYPWSGHQFVDPAVGGTRVRAIIGDLDDWCSPTQVQAHIHAMRVGGGDATVRIVPDARHSFDRTTPLEHMPDAAVAPGAPTLYINDDGAFILPTSDEPDPELVDLDGFLYAFNAGYAVRGAHIGGSPELAPLFVEDMMAFWTGVMGLGRR
ncbi:dienelactone hydrolase family protein [Candidatus Poriferisodalis sp.]|uniref:dienelactone hydrolase family protein n=1 Tax=Candidatus Poriferisodalis sp. TaxID=3101277 RepID=UPI003AF7F48A